MKRLISILLTGILALSLQVGSISALAEEIPAEELPLTQTLPPSVTEDGHIDAGILEQWVDAYLHENYWDHPGCEMAIAYWYSGTDETWFYHADDWINGVNWYKLPLGMTFAEKLAAGELQMDSVVTGITLEYAMKTMVENSSGPSIYSLMTFLGGDTAENRANLAKQYTGLPDSYYTDDFYRNNGFTARLMMEITKTLYQGGEERFPNLLEHMKKSQPEEFFKRDWNVRTKWEVAQIHAADWGGEGDDLIHCTGILYTPTPVVLTIMTKNIWDFDIIGGITGHFADLAVEMDLRQHRNEPAEVPVANPAEPDTGTSEPDPGPENQNNGMQAEPVEAMIAEGTVGELPEQDNEAATESSAVTPEPEKAGSEVIRSRIYPAVILLILLVVIAVMVLLLVRKRREEEHRRRQARLRRQRERKRREQERE